MYVRASYYGLMLGTPNEDMDRNIVQSIKNKACNLFSGKVSVIAPEVIKEISYNRLPYYAIIADLETFEPEVNLTEED